MTENNAAQPVLTTGQILSMERRSNMTDDEALRFARAVESALLSKLRAPVADERPLRHALERIADSRNTHFAGDAQVVARAALASAPVAGEADQDEMERQGWVNTGYKHDLEKARRAISFCNIPGFDTMSLDNAIYWLRAKADDAAPQASEAQCSCPSGDGSLRHPCAVHPQASEAVRDWTAILPQPHTDMRYHGEFVRGWNQCLQQVHAALSAQPGAQKYWLCCGSKDPNHSNRRAPDCFNAAKAKWGTADQHSAAQKKGGSDAE